MKAGWMGGGVVAIPTNYIGTYHCNLDPPKSWSLSTYAHLKAKPYVLQCIPYWLNINAPLNVKDPVTINTYVPCIMKVKAVVK